MIHEETTLKYPKGEAWRAWMAQRKEARRQIYLEVTGNNMRQEDAAIKFGISQERISQIVTEFSPKKKRKRRKTSALDTKGKQQ